MKKFLISLLAMILVVSNVLAFVACDTGKHEHETESKTETKVETEKETEKPGHSHTDKTTEKHTEKTTETSKQTETEAETTATNSSDDETQQTTETVPVTDTVTETETKKETGSETEKETESETLGEQTTESGTLPPQATESETESGSDEACKHSWGEWTVITDATCVKKGSQSRKCTECGEIEKQEIPFTDHKGGEATCTQYAKCSECGSSYGTLKAHEWIDASCTKAKHCKNCSETEGDPLGHKGGTATCTELAKCSVCGEKYGSLAEHEWLEPDCTQPQRCANCSATEGKPVGHSGGVATCKDLARCEKCSEKYGSFADHTWIEADCDEPRHCDVCGEKEGEKLDHTGGTATCTELAVCTECGQKYGELAPHVWDDATCTSPKSCKNCSETEGEPAGHKGGEATCTDLAVCSVCSNKYGEFKGHDWIEASCTEPKHCNDCSAIDGVALGHEGGEATCTALAVCTRCGNGYGSYIPHSFTSKNTDSAYLSTYADCDSPAYYFYSCACGLRGEEKFADGEALGHKYTYISNGDGTHTYVCANDETHTGSENCSGGEATCIDKAVCDFCKEEYGEPKGHDWNLGGIPLSDESDGTVCTTPVKNTYYCSDCDATKVEIIPAPGHKYDSNVVDPTCAAGGYTEHTCSVCGDYYTDNATEATDAHSWNADRTCTAGHVCSVCGKTEAALGHSHVLADTKAATCTEPAKNIYECSTCSDSYEVVTAPANGHDLTDVKPVETELGACAYLQQFECKTCHTLIDGETVYHHKYTATIPDGKEANCQNEGEKKYDCSECGHSYTEKIKVDPTAHVWDGGVKNGSTITYSCTVDGCSETKSVIDASDKDEADVDVSDLSAGGVEFNEATLDVSGLTGTDVLAGSDKVTLAAGTLKDETLDAVKGALTDEERDQLGDNPIYNFSMMDGDTPITSFGDNYVTVTIPYTLAEGEDVDSIAVWYIDGTELVSIKATYSNGYITFKTNHFSYYSVTRLNPKQRCALYGHSETYTTVAPTCTDEGYTLVLCIRCAATFKKDIVPALGHNYTSHTDDPSCTSAGKTVYECSTCSHSYFDVIPAKGHAYTVEITDATCYSEGSEVGTCACGNSYTNIIPKLPHVTDATVIKPTCEADGYTLHECKNCDYSYTDSTVSAIGHKLTDSWEWAEDHKTATVTLTCENDCDFAHTKTLEATETNVEANCLKSGKTEFTIKYVYNGETFSDSFVEKKAKTEHVYEDTWKHNNHGHWHKCRDCSGQSERFDHEFDRENGIVIKIATCISEGQITYACFCGETITETIPVTEGHRYVDNVCIDCGEKKPCEHKYNGGEITTPPTCMTDGVKTYTCFACGETKTEKVSSVKHHTFDEGTVTLEPSCTDEGIKTYTCLYCPETKIEILPSHKGHSFNEGEITAHPSCLNTGLKLYTCDRCGATKQETIPSLGGHKFNDGVVKYEPSCLKDGLMIYTCSECGNTKNEIIPSLGGHDFDDGEIKYAPSCEKEGLKVYTCSNCGETKNEIIPSLGGHKWGEGKRTEPTCTESGKIVYVCENCGQEDSEFIPSLGGHKYGEGEITLEPTCSKAGTLVYTCSECGNKKTQSIDATGEHNYVGGTCTECGHKDGVCDHISLHSVTVDLAKYGACGGQFVYLTCDCGEIITMNVSSEEIYFACDFEFVTIEEGVDGNGIPTQTLVMRCKNCGFTVSQFIKLLNNEGCSMTVEYDIDFTIGDTEILTDIHSVETTESHYSITYRKIDLCKEYGACGGYAELEICNDCGKIIGANQINTECYGDIETEEYVDDNGYIHTVETFTCNKCGLRYVCNVCNISSSVCETITEIDIKVYNDDELILHSYTNSYDESHNFETTIIMNGDTCEEGYYIVQECTNCGLSSRNEWYGHRTEIQETDILTCGGYLVIDRCTVCQEIIGISELSCRPSNVESFESVNTDTGVVHRGQSFTCEKCGLYYRMEYWTVSESECIKTMQFKHNYVAGNGASIELEARLDEGHHDYKYEYTFHGEDCNDGYTVNATCSVCKDSYTQEGSGHIYSNTHLQLGDMGSCGGYIAYGSCPCGQEGSFNWDLYNGFTNTEYTYTDGDGILHTVTRFVCACGEGCTVILRDSYTINREGCFEIARATYTVTVRGKEIISNHTCTEHVECHNYEITVELMGDSCEDGVRVNSTCTECNQGMESFFYDHTPVYFDTVTFSEHGACERHAFIISKCACGERSEYTSDIFELEYDNDSNTYSCTECGIVLKSEEDVAMNGCEKTIFDVVTATINGETITLYSDTESSVQHKYTVSVSQNKNGTVTVIKECTVCKDVKTDTSKRVKLSHGDFGACYDLEFTPSENAVYTIFSIGEDDTRAELYAMIDGELQLISEFDDTEFGFNFRFSYHFEAGVTYVIRMSLCSGEEGFINYLMTSDADCHHDYNMRESFASLLPTSTTCSEGVMRGDICLECGSLLSLSTVYDHTAIISEYIELSEFDVCGYARLYKYSCPCGQNDGFGVESYCDSEYEYFDYTDEEGVSHNGSIYNCRNCALTIVEDNYTVKDGCTWINNFELRAEFDGVTVASYSEETGRYENHEYVTKYFLLGSTCEDGVIAKEMCKYCDLESGWQNTFYYHNTHSVFYADFYGLGGCSSHYFSVEECACGYYHYVNTNISELPFDAESGERFCSDCGMSFSYSVVEDVVDCIKTVTTSLSVTIGGEEYSLYNESESNVYHSFEASIVTHANGSVSVVRKCSECSLTVSDAFNYVDLVDHGGIYYYDITVTPDKDTVYDILSMSETDTYVSLYVLDDGELVEIGYNDDSAGNGNFHLRFMLEAGKTYVYRIRNLYANDSRGFSYLLAPRDEKCAHVTDTKNCFIFKTEQENCEKGFYECKVCLECGALISLNEYSYHNTYVAEEFDLGTLGTCGGYLNLFSCPCGYEHWIDWGYSCNMVIENYSYTDDDGIEHLVEREFCETCGLEYVRDRYTKVKDCFTYEYCAHTVRIGDKTLVDVLDTESKYGEHNHIPSFTLHGEDCDDGYTVTYTCICGDYYTEEGVGHSRYYTYYELSELGACGGYIETYTCACGEDSGLHWSLYCNYTHTSDSYSDENGIVHNIETFTCETCGAVITEETYAEKIGCYDYNYRIISASVGDSVILSDHVSVEAYGNYHDIEYTFTLHGENCDDGYTEVRTCKKCGEQWTSEGSGHYSYLVGEYDLSELGACGGYVEIRSCPCGEQRRLYYNTYCYMQNESSEYVDDNGITHYVFCQSCSECGLTIRRDSYRTKVVCDVVEYYVYNISIGDNVIADGVKVINSSWTEHDYLITYELGGGSCTDGLKLTYSCKTCGYSYTSEDTNHVLLEKEYISLADFGACGGYVKLRECPCGEERDLVWSLEGCSYYVNSESYVDGDGYRHSVDTFTCDSCGIVVVRDSYSTKIGCMAYDHNTYSISIGDTAILEGYSYVQSEYESHDYSYSFTLEGESCYDYYSVTMTCKDCGYTVTNRRYGHSYYPIASFDTATVGGCGGKITAYSCACGSQQRVDHIENLNCSFEYSRDYFDDENGVRHSATVYTCKTCGLKVTYDEYTVTEGCKTSTYRCYTANANGSDVFEYKYLYSYRMDHTYEYSFTLMGETCEDGYTVNYTCLVCGDTGSNEEYSHYIYHMPVVELADYGACGGTMTVRTCACGYNYNVNFNYACSFNDESTTYTDDDGIKHNVTTFTCGECGFVVIQDRYSVKENCIRSDLSRMTASVNGVTLLDGKIISRGVYEDHDLDTSFTMNGDSCEDGVDVQYTCRDCDYIYTDTFEYHRVFESEFYDFKEFGACGGYVTISECPCKQQKEINYELECDYTDEYYERTDENGIPYTLWICTCEACGLVSTTKTYSIKEGCFRNEYTVLTVKVGDTSIVNELTWISWTYEEHEFKYEFVLKGESCEDGFSARGVCECGAINEFTSHYHSSYEMRRIELSDEGACSGYISIWECPCGYKKRLNFSTPDCIFDTDFRSYTDENGVKHDVSTAICSECGLKMETDIYTVKEGCYRNNYYAYTFTMGDQILLDSYAYVDTRYSDHDVKYTFSLDGESCTDGVSVLSSCKDCDYEYSFYITGHQRFTESSIDLSEYGACGGKITFTACPCGLSKSASFDISDCNYDETSNQYYDDEGRLIYNTTYSCDECGLRISSSYYREKADDECMVYSYYTLLVNVGAVAVCNKNYTNGEVSHDLSVTAKLDDGAESCENGVTLTYTCRDCDYSYNSRYHYHSTYEKERIVADNVCGGYVSIVGCACGYSNSVNLSNLLCERDYRTTDAWIDDIIPSGRYSMGINSHININNEFGIYTCSVTDPEACAYKIRYAIYYRYDGECIAQQYVTYQIGYDEETGTYEKEVTYKTGRRYACHTFVREEIQSTLDNGTLVQGYHDSCKCGTYRDELFYYNANNVLIKSETVFFTTTDDRVVEIVSEKDIYEYIGTEDTPMGNHYTLHLHEQTFRGGGVYSNKYEYEYDFAYVAPFGENGYIIKTTITENGNVTVNENAYTYYKDCLFPIYEYSTYNYTSGKESWFRYDYTYSFDGRCMRTVHRTGSSGVDETETAEYHNRANHEQFKYPTCTQFGLYGYVCVICDCVTSEYLVEPTAHHWRYSSEKGCYYCRTCGLENANGASGEIVMEDLTEAYGNGENYVVGYWNRDKVDFIYNVSLILHTPLENGDDQIILTDITFTSLEEVVAISFSKSDVAAAAEALGYSADEYDVRFSFVPVGSDSTLDYAITFTD